MKKYNTKIKKCQEEKRKSSFEKYSDKKRGSIKANKRVLKHVSPKMQERISECSTFVSWLADETKEKKKHNRSNRCGNRFCMICKWVMAKKDALKTVIMMKYLQSIALDFIMVTLTAPNVKGEILPEELTKFNRAFNLLIKRPEVKRMAKGFMRKLEITYNKRRKDFHPHFHVLIAVNKRYFKDKDYIKRDKWLQMWQEVMNDESVTQVDVRKFNWKDPADVYEMATYAAKDDDLYDKGQAVFDFYYKALKGRQIITYGGIFAEANKLYKNGELDYLKEVDKTEYVYEILYLWGFSEYVEKECRELTAEERKNINRQLIDEINLE